MTGSAGSIRNEVAYYYPEPYWRDDDGEWLKTLLLFFDGVSILLPKYMADIHRIVDESLAGPLEDKGLLHVLRPEEFIDQEAAELLAMAVVNLIAAGFFDHLPKSDNFAELSRSRTGWSADAELSDWLVQELVSRDLARPSSDGVSVPMHPVVRTTILVLLAQQARSTGMRHGLDLHPVAGYGRPLGDLISVLSMERSPSAGHVVELDLEAVSIDLSIVPLDDLLQFRADHGREFREYARNLQRFVSELALLGEDDRRSRIIDRQEELADAASDLRRATKKRWYKPFGKASLGLAGAAWNAATNDPFAALLGVGTSVLDSREVPSITAYSYLLRIDKRFGDY